MELLPLIGVTIMNNENKEHTRMKILAFLDGKLNIKLEWPYRFNTTHSYSSFNFFDQLSASARFTYRNTYCRTGNFRGHQIFAVFAVGVEPRN